MLELKLKINNSTYFENYFNIERNYLAEMTPGPFEKYY